MLIKGRACNPQPFFFRLWHLPVLYFFHKVVSQAAPGCPAVHAVKDRTAGNGQDVCHDRICFCVLFFRQSLSLVPGMGQSLAACIQQSHNQKDHTEIVVLARAVLAFELHAGEQPLLATPARDPY